ncbi:surface antigen BspA-like [Trichomonas vaginalis G3]|uniref:Surface antigen BspA-like n=1 Tax=Trichomonas vaginalis (strain ATCC PRA-98 / G3) TaxID=412133 RepID=A2EJB5_TRIV3|nr:ribonuclease inhibitor domain-containing protein [Trichomonas vaginalis G3]EAY07267.1 surface antigen BspA-like [Trichomonas vaginalis G3]KAI5511961.1 ribonuclease inhibitor domain-containing protein [Trichomonas vaginalis G3]|eukprot:XP_001319490.1 surface antigen BspA-like [Trichomonas vaginalis G3]
MFSLLFARSAAKVAATINGKEYTGETLKAILDSNQIEHVYEINASGDITFSEFKLEPMLSANQIIMGNMLETDLPDELFKESSVSVVSFAKVQRIGKGAFLGAKSLKSASFPEAIQVSKNAFSGCGKLETVDIPKAISIEDAAFSGSGIKNVTFSNALIMYSSVFADCQSLIEVNLPNVSCIIDDMQFFNCSNLTTIRLPSVKILYFNNSQFVQNSPNLTSLYFPANPPEGVEDQTFNLTDATKFNIVLPSEKDWKNYISQSNISKKYEIVYKGYNSHVIDSSRKFKKTVLPYLIIAIVVVVIGVAVGLGFYFYKKGSLDSILPNSRLV